MISSWRWRTAFFTVMTVRSRLKGFSIKLNAPNFVARTAVSIFPWPEIITTVASFPSSFNFCSVASPSIPSPSQMSSKMQLKTFVLTSSRHASPDSAVSTAKPSSPSTPRKVSRMPFSSSTTRTEFCIYEFTGNSIINFAPFG